MSLELPKDQLLALDIGTRSVIGVLLRPEGENYSVIDYERVEHMERAMLDGQIHDIDKVTDVVRAVVGALQERNGTIHQAAIAAAGRTLVTQRTSAEIELDVTREIDKEVTDRLQMLAVQKAQGIVDQLRNAGGERGKENAESRQEAERGDGGRGAGAEALSAAESGAGGGFSGVSGSESGEGLSGESVSGEMAETSAEALSAAEGNGFSEVSAAVGEGGFSGRSSAGGADSAGGTSGKKAADEEDVEFDGEFRGVRRVLSTDDYYTVGHSIIEYRLDGSLILNPHGHRGNRLAVEVIATFLPHIVVDSLYTVLNKAGLDVLNLTLEPIAAMNVAIPKKLRLLNLALVDIGAGTSDIAISKDGTIHSYGMVAMAGDSVTEVIAKEYLLDFNAAERLKISAGGAKKLKYTDVLGFTHDVTAEEIHKKSKTAVNRLAGKIAESVKELNGKAPSAVFCIGGGSQLFGLKESLCKKLGLAKDRVTVKSVEQLEMVSFRVEPPKGPEYITPVGIGVTAVEERDHDFIQVSVGGTSIRIFNTKNVRLSDALLLSGYNARSLLSERGQSIFVTIDGVKSEIKGEFGEPARLMVNGQIASLDHPISHKDQIVVYPATAGEPRKIRLGNLVSMDDVVYLNRVPFKLFDYVAVGGVNRTMDYMLKNGDEIIRKGMKTVGDLAKRGEIDRERFVLVSGGVEHSAEDLLVKDTYYEAHPRRDGGSDKGPRIEVNINGSFYEVPDTAVFVDLFDVIGFDTKGIGFERDGEKKSLELLINGREASFLDTVEDGDEIVIRWRRNRTV